MKTPLPQIKAEADTLMRDLPSLLVKRGPASTDYLGAAGRRRAGQGDNFWQYRSFTTEDSVNRVDWRRSARGDHLFVRESELETARTFLFWCDPSAGFDWRGAPNTPTKAARALSISLAFASLITKSGDRCGVLGSGKKAKTGSGAAKKMSEDIWRASETSQLPSINQFAASMIIASDFYRPLEDITNWITHLATKNRHGVLLMVTDPIEASYPYEGRINFFSPSNLKERLIGRAENLRETYLQRYVQRQEDIRTLAHSLGWEAVFHVTDTPAAPPLAHIVQYFSAQVGAGPKPSQITSSPSNKEGSAAT
ncbi:DUF58 domain-containing protein [Hirschia litorea]|uniref:DUF58 domain-containing protein n=1 Tax=Hirschia litorea TaxID=1199156 RepID=A0ABW2IKE2_9PROT